MPSQRFQKATRKKARLRMAIDGPAGAGKSYCALRFAFALGKKVAAIDTESGSLSKYQGDSPDGTPFDFDVMELSSYSPTEYTSAIEEAGRSRYDVLIIDSLSHAWVGKDGALEIKDRQGGNSFTGWKDVTPMHNRMIEAVLQSPCHVIATMRSKTEYVLEEEVNKQGKTVMVPRKIGLAPIQRSGMEYEFDIYGSIDWSHVFKVTKSRCSALADVVVSKPGASFMRTVIDWLDKGTDAVPISLPKRVGEEQVKRMTELLARFKPEQQVSAQKKLREDYHVENFADLLEADANALEKKMETNVRAVEEAAKKKAASQANGTPAPDGKPEPVPAPADTSVDQPIVTDAK